MAARDRPIDARSAWRRPDLLALVVTAIALLPGCDASNAGGAADGGVPRPPIPPFFTDVTDELGLDARHVSGARGAMHMPEIMGSGVGVLDADGDGLLDIYLVNGNANLPSSSRSGTARNRLFLQQQDGTMRDATEESGLGDTGYGMGLATGDIDNDGDVDVYVTNWGEDRLYRNRGDGRFDDVTEQAGVSVGGWSCSAAFLDFDRDGWLDLYVTRYVKWTEADRCFDTAGRPDYCAPSLPSDHDVLLRNLGDGRFEDVSTAAGIATTRLAGLGVLTADLDDDGWTDIYVANDAQPNTLWINQGNGTFVDEAVLRGVSYNVHGQPEAGMGLALADVDGDLHLDIFVTHTTIESNTLYRGLGPGRGFLDATGESGLGASSMIYTGFGTAALDVELDGDRDLVVVNGRVQRADPDPLSDAPAPWDRYAEPNLLYLNDGHGVFERADARGGPLVSRIEVSRGLAAADLDRDGDLDIVITNTEAPLRVYRNDAPRAGHWLSVRAVDPELRRVAVGARVSVQGGGRGWVASIAGGTGYLSAAPAVAHFGLGDVETIDRIEVRWPGGDRERFAVEGVDRTVELRRGDGEAVR